MPLLKSDKLISSVVLNDFKGLHNYQILTVGSCNKSGKSAAAFPQDVPSFVPFPPSEIYQIVA